MAQFYLLSVLFNVLAGLILVYGTNLSVKSTVKEIIPEESVKKTAKKSSKKEEKESAEKEDEADEKNKRLLFRNFTGFDNKNLRLITGVLSVFVGIMKFLSVFRNDVPVIGDLLPAVAGLAGGVSILIEYYLSSTTEEVDLPEAVQKIFIDSRKYIGVLCLFAALLHFIFPQVMLL